MKIRNVLSAMCIASVFVLMSCAQPATGSESKQESESEFDIMYKNAVTSSETKSDDGTKTLTITVKNADSTDRIYVKSNKEIYLLSKADTDKGDKAPEYTLTGKFEGQIINLTSGSVLNLEGVELYNVDNPAIYGKKRTDLSAKKGTDNKIIVTGSTDASKQNKDGAVYCKKKVEIGGKGKLNIVSSMFHGIKAEKIQLKGGVALTITTNKDGDGNYTYADGSGINCKSFEIDTEKTFTVVFKGFKHGFKADDLISIKSGTFDFTGVEVPFKTDTGNGSSVTIQKDIVTDTLVLKIKDDGQKDKVLSDTKNIDDSLWVK